MTNEKTVQLALRLKESTSKGLAKFFEDWRARLNTGQASANRALTYQVGLLLTLGKLSDTFVREARLKQVSFDEFYRDIIAGHLAEIDRCIEERRPVLQHPDNAKLSYLASLGCAEPLAAVYRSLCGQLGITPVIVEEPQPLGRQKGSVRGDFATLYPFRNAVHGATSLQDFIARLRKAGIHFKEIPREKKEPLKGEHWIFTFISVDGVKPGHQLHGSQLGLYNNTSRGFQRSPTTLLKLWADGKQLFFKDPEELLHSKVRASMAKDARSRARKS